MLVITNGLGIIRSQQSTKNERSAALNKWKIAIIIVFILSVVTLAVGIFAAVKYKDIAHRLTSTKPTFVGDNKTTPMIIHTSTITTKPTYSTTSTDSITKLSIVTTPTDAFTDVIMTNPREPQFFCTSDEDKLTLELPHEISINSYRIWGENKAFGYVQTDPKCGSMYIGNEEKKAMLEVSVASGYYSTASNWSFYYHSITSPKEKSAVACLLNDTQSFDGYVYTWQKVGENNEVVSTYQCIVAFYSQSRTYIIRTYSSNITDNVYRNPLEMFFTPDQGKSKYIDTSLEKENIAGKRFISDVSEPDYKNGNITFVYQGENCDFVMC